MFTILIIGAHLDECEFGVGGLSHKLAKLGHKAVFLKGESKNED